MVLVRSIRPMYRVGVILVGIAIAAASVLFTATGSTGALAGSTPKRAAAGTIHVFLVDTSATSTSNPALITGAFSDHGGAKSSVWHLSRGNITFNASKLQAILNSSKFGTFFPASCSFSGTTTTKVFVVSGTKAYVGIKGTLTVTASVAEEGSLLKNGKCNEASNAPLVAVTETLVGSGKVTF